MDAPLVSILIVNFNGVSLLRDCLGSLRKVTYPRFEVVVVDNASTDGSVELLGQYPEVRLVRSERNRGFAGGNNFGLAACQGELVLLLNSDTIVTPGFLEPLVEYLQQHPQVGIVQGKMLLSRHGNVLDVCGSFLTRFGFLYHYGYWKPDGEKYHHSYPIFAAKGACLMFRRNILPAIGGYLFEEDFFCYYEETDLCHRAWLSGYEVHFVHGSVIQHLQGATSERTQASGFGVRQYLTNQTFALLSNLEAGSLLRMMPGYFAVFLVSMGAAAVTFNGPMFGAHRHALTRTLLSLGKIRAHRRRIRQIRKVSDRAIFARVLRNPRWDYSLRTLQGRLRDYADEPLNAAGGREPKGA
jgi:GT2 family glycosyltransferase